MEIFTYHKLPQRTYKPHKGYHDFSPFSNGVYFIAIVSKSTLHNGTRPITDLITKMGVQIRWDYDIEFTDSHCLYILDS